MATWVITIAEHHPGCAQFVTFKTVITNRAPLDFIHDLQEADRERGVHTPNIALINAWKDTELV